MKQGMTYNDMLLKLIAQYQFSTDEEEMERTLDEIKKLPATWAKMNQVASEQVKEHGIKTEKQMTESKGFTDNENVPEDMKELANTNFGENKSVQSDDINKSDEHDANQQGGMESTTENDSKPSQCSSDSAESDTDHIENAIANSDEARPGIEYHKEHQHTRQENACSQMVEEVFALRQQTAQSMKEVKEMKKLIELYRDLYEEKTAEKLPDDTDVLRANANAYKAKFNSKPPNKPNKAVKDKKVHYNLIIN